MTCATTVCCCTPYGALPVFWEFCCVVQEGLTIGTI
jgi:hypothetical protein